MVKKAIGGDAGSSTSGKMDQDVGSVFKRTEIIGRGKFGVVYKGYHVKTKQVYAIKVLNLDSDEDEVDDVQREIQFLASMKQVPNITHYYGSYLRDTSLWIIIEYCAGGSLRTLLRPGKIDEKYIGVIMRELLMALKYIHKDNIIHRDIKAANVLITNDGQVKLCDFGVAAQLNQASAKRQTMAGTPYWMAPEVIMEGVYYDTKVDIWSLGITTYEIATGNPPYCEVEALRAMQLITKSKPPRLEGRNYSILLKEFIALCLDEDSKERLSAEELLKTKFIKAHRATSTTLLKQLISRYLLFRDNKNTTRENVFFGDEDPKGERKKALQSGQPNGKTEDTSDVDVDVKWDFDSLSSADYIIENDINVEEIPGGSTHDWASAQQDQYNYAYPDEDQFYYYPTNTNGKVYQGTTMGKTQQGTMLHNSTLNAPLSHTNTTGNFPTKMMKSVRTTPTVGTGTHTNSAGTKRSETKVPKKLSELFEKVEETSESVPVENELSRMSRNASHLHMGSLPEDSAAHSVSDLSAVRPHVGAINNGNFHSQSTPALPVIQTKFNKVSKGPSTAATTAPTPIEIEIPEELPTTTAVGASNVDAPMNSQTKPRSSTVSTPGPAAYQKAPGISRRLTVGTAVGPSTSRTMDEKSKKTSNSPNDNAEPGALPSNLANVASSGPGTWNNKFPLTSPSPSRSHANVGSSPTKRLGNSPTAGAVLPPTMKALGNTSENKDPLLQPINTNTHNEAHNPMPDMEISRVNRDFKRNNPNLKLQMPLPTSVVPHKLLDPSLPNAAAPNTNASATGENINQFGFNTSSASNIPVSMTPINEKHIDWGKKPKRGPSFSNRKNSQNTDLSLSASAPGSTSNVSGVQTMLPLNTGPMSNSSINVASMFPSGSTTNVASAGVQSSQINALGSGNTANNSIGNLNTSLPNAVSGVLHSPTVLQPPPSAINMDIFLDVDAGMPDSNNWADKKPLVLHELEALLKMYENGLPVIENALKKQLISADLAQSDH